MRLRPSMLVLAIPLALLGGAVAWWLASPLFINRTVDEVFPMSQGAIVPDGMTRADVEKEMEDAAVSDTTMAEAMPSKEPVALMKGAFVDGDTFHKGSGTATVYRLEGGKLLLRLDPFQVLNGPDLHVYLSAHPMPDNRDDVHAGPYLDLGKLKGNIGSQNYDLPDGTDIGRYKSVVIYCQPFHVVFSTATLENIQ